MVLFPSALTLTAMSKLVGLVVKAWSSLGRLTLVTEPLLAVKVPVNGETPCVRLP